jgi:hypothetical protein
MSRFSDYDGDEYSPEEVLFQGRWYNNARRALKGKRGRKALAELREALLALPEPRLIGGALCTVGGTARVGEVTPEEVAGRAAQGRAMYAEAGSDPGEDYADECGRWMRQEREYERDAIAGLVETDGEGVCAIGAFIWHQKVKAGMDPAEAFAALPTVAGDAADNPADETAGLGQQAGLTYTLAWVIASKNDQTWESRTPEDRYTAFLAWIDAELGEPAGAA